MKEIIIKETNKMMQSFMNDFFLPYLSEHLDNDDNSECANILMSFAQSSFISIVKPILSNLPTEKRMLRHIKEIIEILEENLGNIKNIAINKEKIN